MRAEMANMRDEIRAPSTTVLRMDGSEKPKAEEERSKPSGDR
jgi:hypothetical protein